MSTPVKYADLIMLAAPNAAISGLMMALSGLYTGRYPGNRMFNVIPLAPGHAYGMFMERFNELSELRKCA